MRQKLEFVLVENRVYRALLDRHSPRWRLQDAERKALAEKGKPLGQLLHDVITIVQSAKRLQAETAAELDALFPAILDRAFNGEL